MSRLRVLLHLPGRFRLPQGQTSWVEEKNDKVPGFHKICQKNAKIGEESEKGKVQNSRKTKARVTTGEVTVSMSNQKMHKNCK